MWRFKPFMQKEPTGLEGRSIDIGNLKIHIRNAIAEGGFSCVYSARDAVHASKQYALKHIICNDQETMELVLKEISVMKSLKGHPNVVTLCAHTIMDMGRTKEALLVMEYCEKSLVSVLESRGEAYFEEKQLLSIFRDVCNAVYAMHCQSPPIAHRDLKAENLLLGSDGLWKLCDFGSTSTNHKRFEKPEEMGIEEDNIRKYTTPAYRAPEMWDLFRKELINEKVDIWALGCILFRLCYFKSAFDGESKLQVLNGNYRIPELPKYSSSITDLIRDMLQASPDTRPDITQVWFRVNEMLPSTLQKSLPDMPPEMRSTDIHEGTLKHPNKVSPMPKRSPPNPPSSGGSAKNTPQLPINSRAGGGGGTGQLGAFWSTQHAKTSPAHEERTKPKFDEEPTVHSTSKQDRSGPAKEESTQAHTTQRNVQNKSHKPEDGPTRGYEINFFPKESESGMEKPKASKSENPATFQDSSFNTFVAEFDNDKLNSGVSNTKLRKEEVLEAEVERLKCQLKQCNMEKAEVTSKFEKLTAICRSQRQEIQELKQSLASRTPSPSRDASGSQASTVVRRASLDFDNIAPSSGVQPWQAFAENPKPQQHSSGDRSAKSVRTGNGHSNKQGTESTSGFESWGFGTGSFTTVSASTMSTSRPAGQGNNSQRFGDSKIKESNTSSQPAGWAGF